jgi:glycosyltransferase involved in cell wall biosynthesis
MQLDLAVVIPVYNEEACIRGVIQSWLDVLSLLNIKFRIIILNDGSNDGTYGELKAFIGNDRIEVIDKENSGHGPSIIMGYKKAVMQADWVFQCDSDDEIKPDHFPHLWGQRLHYDALFGSRLARKGFFRGFISYCSRATVHIIYGRGVRDVNTPYRLIRSEILRQIVDQIPGHTFAPNVIISGVISKAGFRIYEHPFPYKPRRTGETSLTLWRLCTVAIKTFFQTVSCRPVIKSPRIESFDIK